MHIHETKPGLRLSAWALFFASLFPVFADAQTWVFTGSMIDTRREQTATVLQDGNVLIAGGTNYTTFDNAGKYLFESELYDPSNGTWSPTGSMSHPRVEHTATLLDDGKVLAVGGQVDAVFPPAVTPSATAELYDPSTSAWTDADSMDVPRYLHSATKLLDGRVLIAGGVISVGSTVITNSVEIFDSTTGLFTTVAPMHQARFCHSASLLLDGRVLVAGGNCGGGHTPLSAAEVYDPSSNTWTVVGSMSVARGGGVTATTLNDGKVLVMGGVIDRRSVDVFNPISDIFTPTTPSNEDNDYPAVLLGDGRVLVTGGMTEVGVSIPSQVYDPVSQEWETLGDLNEARRSHTAVLLPGNVALVAGGLVQVNGTFGVAHTNSAELLNIPLMLTPVEQAEVLLQTMIDMGLPHNIENSYHANLKKLADFIEGGKIDAALGQLDAFIGKVETDYSEEKISLEERDVLIELAQALVSTLEAL